MHTKFGLILATMMLVPSVCWTQEYSVTDLGTFGGSQSIASSVNNAGQVAGQSDISGDVAHAFLYTNGSMLDLGVLDGFLSNATSVNDKGDVAGYIRLRDEPFYQAFLYSDGTTHFLDPAHPHRESQGISVNLPDTVLGYVNNRPAIFSNGTVTHIPLGKYYAISPAAINDFGQIAATCDLTLSVNEQACLIVGGTVSELKPLHKSWSGLGSAINTRGDVCGSSFPSTSGRHAVVWSTGSVYDLGTLPKGTEADCESLNNFGQEVGNVSMSDTDMRGVLFDTIQGAQDLNNLIGQNTGLFQIWYALSISDTGYIAAECAFSTGAFRACLLTPNHLFIAKKDIVALEQNDPGCVQCKTVLEPEADSLPDTLTRLTAEQQKQVISTVDLIIVQVERLQKAEQIGAAQSRLLTHELRLIRSEVSAE